MDNIFTWLIILFAVISFLNKIFGKNKKPQSTRGQPAPKPKPVEWIPPWLQPDEVEFPFGQSKEEDLDVVETIERESVSVEASDQKEDAVKPYVEEKKIEQAFSRNQTDNAQFALKQLEALSINLSSSDELRKGIVLAEILGPCRAKRNLTRG